MTGTGKTSFITGLDGGRWTVIDLEGLARHRGSAFGSLGLGEQPAQKRFDTLLWDAFRSAPEGRPIVVEGESQRIGRIMLPGQLYDAMSAGIKVWCHAPMETRVARLAAEYAREEYREPMAEALERIRKKLGGVHHAELRGMLDNWDVAGLARGLVEQYYDRLYYKHRPWTPDMEINLEDFNEAEQRLTEFWRARPQT
jgi:tRNA 2-selenouridine synthase